MPWSWRLRYRLAVALDAVEALARVAQRLGRERLHAEKETDTPGRRRGAHERPVAREGHRGLAQPGAAERRDRLEEPPGVAGIGGQVVVPEEGHRAAVLRDLAPPPRRRGAGGSGRRRRAARSRSRSDSGSRAWRASRRVSGRRPRAADRGAAAAARRGRGRRSGRDAVVGQRTRPREAAARCPRHRRRPRRRHERAPPPAEPRRGDRRGPRTAPLRERRGRARRRAARASCRR